MGPDYLELEWAIFSFMLKKVSIRHQVHGKISLERKKKKKNGGQTKRKTKKKQIN